MPAPETLSPEQLIALYNIAVDEYRFEVKLNWDRTAFYITLNSGLVAIATGLLKVEGTSSANLIVAAIFFIGLCVSAVGIRSVKKGHDYYRRAVVKKTLIEDRLGLTQPSGDYATRPTLTVGTTAGQDEHFSILHNTEEWLARPLGRRSITWSIIAILFLFCLADITGIAGSLWLRFHPNTAPPSSPVFGIFRYGSII